MCYLLLRTRVPLFYISYYSFAIILVSASSSCFTLAVPMREVYCVGYTPRAWDPRSLQPVLDGPLFFRSELALVTEALRSIDQISRLSEYK